jgi:tRNA(Ile)-lysidine synthase
VAIGQHLDDQSESFFINLIRGTGIAGMHGIAKNANRIIRPLLFATRTQIEEYVASENIGFREDSSNASDKYQRNYIRHHILPHFNQLRPDFSATLNQSLEYLSEIEQYALKHLDKQCNELIINEHDGSFGIARKQLHAIAFPKLILFHILKDYGFQHSHIENILRLLQDEGNGKRVENTSHRVWIDRDKIIVQQKEIALEIAEQLNDLNSDKWHQNQLETEFPYQGDYKVQDSKLAFLDYDKLQFPLEIRNWKQGDTFTPLGMKGKKKISDFIIDQKLDIIAKQQLQVLCSSGKIVWIIGQRIDQHFAIGGKTKNILKITYYGHS